MNALTPSINPDDVAIIGMAGLFPMAEDAEALWSNILHKVDAVTPSPPGWLGDGSILDPLSPDPMRIYTRMGGFLGELSRFDARQFGTMPLSVTGAQPDQFLALKVAHDALVDAGYQPGQFDGHATGVILGHAVHAHRGNANGMQQAWFQDQTRGLLRALFPEADPARVEEALRMMQAQLPPITPEAVPGLVPNVLTGRICNRLDLMGPNYIIDAACSSSLIAIDLAIHELRSGRAEMMLAGGVNTTTSPLVFSVFCSVNALSRDGRIRPFDAGANGTVLGEGAGVIVLKRLRDALAAGDRVHAVVKGVGQSSDGKSSGLMAPRLEGEVLAMRRAYQSTGIDPATIGLLEAHGTGIPLGDRTEVDALRSVFGPREGLVPTVPMGSVKSMIGHCIPASGSAAVIKVASALRGGVIPPTLCDDASDAIGLDTTPFHVATEARPWVHGAAHPRRAAINAFGFGGINAHMILEEPPGSRSDPTAAFLPPPARVARPVEHVFPFAGPARAAVAAQLDAFGQALGDGADLAALSAARWEAVAGAPGPARLAAVASDAGELSRKLAQARARLLEAPAHAPLSLQTRNGLYYEDAPLEGEVAFLFPGEMAQYPGMMRDVGLAHPVARGWLDFIAALTDGRRPTRLQNVMDPPGTTLSATARAHLDELMHRVDYGSEMVFAADQAAFALLTAMGIRPQAMLGHSTGENAALVASGRLALDRGGVGAMIARMNHAFAAVETSGAVPSGTLLNVAALERAGLDRVLAAHPGLHFTMDNCPNQAIVFGRPEDADAAEREAVAEGAVVTRLPISWGYHTAYVAPMAEAFGAMFDEVRLQDSPIRLYSCATAAPFPEDREGFGRTAVAQYTSRVRFTEAVRRLHDDGVRVFVECGPGSVLTGFVRDILGDRPHLAVAADNRRRGMAAQLRHLAGQLFAAGVPLDPREVLLPREDAHQTRRRIARERHRAAPRLASDLPFVALDAAAAGRLAACLRGDARPDAARPAPEPAPEPVPGPAPEPRGAPMAEPVAARPAEPAPAAVAAAPAPAPMRRPAPRPDPERASPRRAARPAPRRAVAPSRRIEVLDLAPGFGAPFPLAALLLRGAPPLDAVLPHLAPHERLEAQEAAARRHPAAFAEWSLSRLAAKRAGAAMLGGAVAGAALPIRKDARGAPFFDRPGAPALSIAHAGGVGLAACAAPGWRVGLDYEEPGRVRDARAFLLAVAAPSERAGLPATADAAALLWALKEAASKALGVGLGGRPLDWVVEGAGAPGAARVRHGADVVEARARRVGAGVAALAWAPGEPSLGGDGDS